MKPNYSRNDPRGWGGNPKRGAALGRMRIHNAPSSFDGFLLLQRIKLDSGGYDRLGTYWGHGSRLYWYAADDEHGTAIDAVVRCASREDAKRIIRESYPNAKFYR